MRSNGDSMKLLALDCTGSACSAALWRDGEIAVERCREMARGHAEALMPMIGEVMAAANERLGTLDRIAVTVGPGSFTGVRVGLAAARGLALAIGCPLIGVGTLAVLAEATGPEERANRTVLAVLDARRDEVYAQAFDERLTPLAPPRACRTDAALDGLAAPVLIVGSGAALVDLAKPDARLVRADAPDYPIAAQVAALAVRQELEARPGCEVAPLYLRGAGANAPDDLAAGRRR
jgi:tRNA threonylcarbamoyladenosine biosynthesis protein TsaB